MGKNLAPKNPKCKTPPASNVIPLSSFFKPGVLERQLQPDRVQLESFIRALFRHAGNIGYASIRAFEDDTSPFEIKSAWLKQGLDRVIDIAFVIAKFAANNKKRVVFAPPIAVFNGDEQRAREQDLLLGLALSVECDKRAQAARTLLEQLLGPATVVVASGGEWTDPETGEVLAKLHLHWRLQKPTADEGAHKKLKKAREYAMRLVGSDPSNVPIVHPIRWPGSWHRKGEPKLCTIVELNADTEIDLDTALDALQKAAPDLPTVGKSNSSTNNAAPEPFGQVAKEERELNPTPTQKLNNAALANYAAWVPELFPNATPYQNGGYRVTSADLGRENEEDLSFHPEGIKDFGVHDLDDPLKGKRTPVNIVMEHMLKVPIQEIAARTNTTEFEQARDWLRERVGDGDGDGDADADAKQDSKQPKPIRFKLIPFHELRGSTALTYLVKGVIPRVGLVVIWGPPKCGKSFWMFTVAMHVALGWEYRDRKVQSGPVVYCAFEGAAGFGKRADAFRQEHGIAADTVIPFFLEPLRMEMVGDHKRLIAEIKVQTENPVMVVLDTLNRSLKGSESSDADMSAYVNAADAIREAFNCCVAIVHHCGHEGTRPRGHTSLPGAVEAQLAVSRDENIITVKVEMAKDDAEGDEIVSQLKTVPVGTDDRGDEATSCVILPADPEDFPPKRTNKENLPTGANKIALDLLWKAVSAAGEIPPLMRDHIPPDTKAVLVKTWRDYCDKGMISDSRDPEAKRKAFLRARTALQAAKFIGSWADWVWANPLHV